MYLNKYEEQILESKELQFLFKNLETHFKKLFYSVAYISKIQNNEEFIRSYNQTGVVSISSIEYCYYKISTIWDIAYQIADKLIFPKNKGKGFDKYKYLEERFEKYTSHLEGLHLNWYKDVNKIRNKIVHGGITVNPYYVNDAVVSNRICFQAYDFDLEDLVQPHYMYSNQRNNDINFADNYFTFYTHLLYSYLADFFEFVLLELNEGKKHDLENLSFDEFLYDCFEKDHKTWLLSDVDLISEVTEKMIVLELTKGHPNLIHQVSDRDVKEYFNYFPFTMMNKISKGDFI